MLDLMLLELYRVSPEQAEAELVFANMEDEDLVFEEGEPGSTFSTKLLGIVTTDESSPHVAKLWKKLQEQQMQLEKEGFRLPGGQNFYPRFIERLVSINENSPSLNEWMSGSLWGLPVCKIINIQMIYSKSLKESFIHKYSLDINVS